MNNQIQSPRLAAADLIEQASMNTPEFQNLFQEMMMSAPGGLFVALRYVLSDFDYNANKDSDLATGCRIIAAWIHNLNCGVKAAGGPRLLQNSSQQPALPIRSGPLSLRMEGQNWPNRFAKLVCVSENESGELIYSLEDRYGWLTRAQLRTLLQMDKYESTDADDYSPKLGFDHSEQSK